MNKTYHIWVGFVIAWLTMLLFNNIPLAIVLVSIAALGKEIYDIKRTGFDTKDLICTLTGGLMAIL